MTALSADVQHTADARKVPYPATEPDRPPLPNPLPRPAHDLEQQPASFVAVVEGRVRVQRGGSRPGEVVAKPIQRAELFRALARASAATPLRSSLR
jgi:hypothetical protein